MPVVCEIPQSERLFCAFELMTQEDKKTTGKSWWVDPMQMFLRISVWIAFPLIISLFAGQWLDRKFSTAPWLLIACSAVAFILSMYGIIKNAKKEFKKIEEENKKK